METLDPSLPYRSWTRSICLWLLTNAFGLLGLAWFNAASGAFEAQGDKEIPDIIAAFAAGGSLFIIPFIRTNLAKAMVFPTGSQRLGKALLRTLGVVTVAMLGLTAVTCGLGGLAILMGGFVYLPAALLATPIVYIDWLSNDNDTRWLPVYDEDVPLPGEATPEVPEEATR